MMVVVVVSLFDVVECVGVGIWGGGWMWGYVIIVIGLRLLRVGIGREWNVGGLGERKTLSLFTEEKDSWQGCGLCC